MYPNFRVRKPHDRDTPSPSQVAQAMAPMFGGSLEGEGEPVLRLHVKDHTSSRAQLVSDKLYLNHAPCWIFSKNNPKPFGMVFVEGIYEGEGSVLSYGTLMNRLPGSTDF